MVESPSYIMRPALRNWVMELLNANPCGRCLRGKKAELEGFVGNAAVFITGEKKTLHHDVSRHFATDGKCAAIPSALNRSEGAIQVPPSICRPCVQASTFGVSAPTIARYRKKLRRGWLAE